MDEGPGKKGRKTVPEINSFPDYMAAWDRLIKAVDNNQQGLPDLTGLVGPLADLLDEARDLDAAKAAARAQLRQGSKRTRTLIPEGRAAASRLRAALIAHFGSHNEILVEFGITPVRARRVPQRPDPEPPSPPITTPPPVE
jgi:hypothetical protein